MLLIQFIAFLFILQYAVAEKAQYSILAPKVLQPQSQYNIIVSLNNYVGQSNITCELFNQLKGFKVSKISHFDEHHMVQVMDLQSGANWPEGQYDLTITSTDGLIQEKTIVQYNYKLFVIMVQTDKAIYKPGQDVQLRVVILDNLLKPVNPELIRDLRIFILDPQKVPLLEMRRDLGSSTKDQQLYNVNMFNYTNGVTDDIKFNLHDASKPGEWTIQVATHGQLENYTFFVDYYTLPMANVTITLPEYVKFDRPVLNYSVDVFYTFGKPVDGYVLVEIDKIRECGKLVTTDPDRVFHANWTIEHGQIKGSVDLKQTKLLFSNNCPELTLNLSAKAYDNNTDNWYFNFDVFDAIESEIKAEVQDKQYTYRPGKPITKKILLKTRNGDALDEDIVKNYECKVDYKTKTNSTYTDGVVTDIIPSRGMITCMIITGPDYKEMRIRLRNRKSNKFIVENNIEFLKDCATDTIQIHMQEATKTVNINDQVALIVQSTQSIEEFIYYVVIRGTIVDTQYKKAIGKDTYQFFLDITREMVPEVLVAVFMKLPGSPVIISDAVHIYVNGTFHNQVQFDVKTPVVDAGKKAQMVVSAESESKLFFLAIDTAVLALKQGNDLSSVRVLNNLKTNAQYKYDTDSFLSSGMQFLTNGAKECKDSKLVDKIERDDDDDDEDHSVNPKTNNAIRKNFREVWIWDRIDIAHGKSRVGIKSTVPDSITSWKVTAFALHAEKGLGLTTQPGYITVFRPFFLKLNLPYSVRRNETSEFHVTMFNYKNETVDVTLNVYQNSSDKHKTMIQIDNCKNLKQKLQPGQIKSITCYAKSNGVGQFDLVAEASGTSELSDDKVADGELRQLKVIYEGITVDKHVVVDLLMFEQDVNKISTSVKSVLPADRVIGSELLLMTATTELLTSQWNDRLEKLESDYSMKFDFSKPEGCCQQRINRGFPKVFWLDYAKATNRTTPDMENQAVADIQFTLSLLCWHVDYDGSFVYYEQYNPGSKMDNVVLDKRNPFLWQTAYTLQFMTHVSKYTLVSEKSLKDVKNWLKSVQKASGEYIETYADHDIMSTKTNAYLTAYVHKTMLEAGEINPPADKYLTEVFDTLTDPLDMISTCLVLNKIRAKNMDVCNEKLDKLMQRDATGAYWSNARGQPDLYVTAFGLMMLTERQQKSRAMDVFKYIISKQKHDGNFQYGGREQDSLVTVTCMEALTKFHQMLKTYERFKENVFVTFELNGNKQEIHLLPDSPVMQVVEGDPLVNEIGIVAEGFGNAKATLMYQYNTMSISDGAFNISIDHTRHNDKYVILHICTNHKETGRSTSNNIIEIDLPTGFHYHAEKFVWNKDIVDKIEAKEGDTEIHVYIKQLTSSQLCIDIPTIESYNTIDRYAVPVKVYHYYDRNTMSVETYDV
ncbi:CD109 antigen-like [Oppia nitens]|uniref:CD109 antigen-like n=1 Tax=Oppia nitens TaxID=1686743 RepID=UPI0023DBAA50|nr:CD109 antigen-like [Oppia nitens]